MVAGAAVFAALVAFKAQPYEQVIIEGNSMSPTLRSGEIRLASRDVRNISRGDIVVFNHLGSQYVKRVALIEGDKLTAYYFGDQWWVPTDSRVLRLYLSKGVPHRDMRIAKGTVYVVGDNHDSSVDSRTFGPIEVDSITARVVDSDGPTQILAGARLCRLTQVAKNSVDKSS